MPFDTDLSAHSQNRAGRAFGKRSSADVFAKGHQQAIDVDPMRAREDIFQRGQSLLRRFRRYIAPAIRQSDDT
jgi:hypothetical protein